MSDETSDEAVPPEGDALPVLDEQSIPTDPRERILRVPIPLDIRGVPVVDRARFWEQTCKRLNAEHDAKVTETLRTRAIMLQQMEEDPEFRQAVLEKCRRDPVFFLNHFAFTYDDREAKPVTALVLYPAQEALIRDWVREYVDVAVDRVTWFDEKSRAWGWTWVMAVWCRVWLFLFKEGWTVLYGHDKLEKLDDGGLAATHQTTFGKLRYAFRSLPAWFIPEGFWDHRTNKIGLIQHPSKPNHFKADFYSANFGRGDRFSEVVCDEAAASDNFGVAETSFKQTTRRAHIGTTPRGRNNDAGRLRWGSKKKTVRTLHWSDNPRLDAAWYWQQREHYTVEQCAQELDISWDLSVTGRVFKTFSRAIHVADFDYDPNLPLHLSADPGFDDPTALVWIQPHKGAREWRIVDALQIGNRPGEYYVPFLIGRTPERDLAGKPWPYRYEAPLQRIIERHGQWRPVVAAFGGADGRAASLIAGSFSLFDLWEKYGLPFVYPVSFSGTGGAKDDAIRTVEIALRRLRIARRLETERPLGMSQPTIVEAFEQYSWVDRSANKTGRKMKREPKHDIYCHFMDAVQQYLWGEDVAEPIEQPVRRPDGDYPERDGDLPSPPGIIVADQQPGPGQEP